MIKHEFTELTEINFSKLEERIMQINDPYLGKYNDVRKLLHELMINGKPTLVMATGGSKIIAYYLQLIIEKLGPSGMICEVIEPRDYIYKSNKEVFSNLIAISTSGSTNGIPEALSDFKGNRYLISEKKKDLDCSVISWGNELYDKEKSFVSLATTLGPISLFLDSISLFSLTITPDEIKKVNQKIKIIFEKSEEKINKLPIDFKDTSLIQIMSGYDTKTAATILESNLTETGIMIPVIHDKGSFCHGRSNLLFRNPNSQIIYLSHELNELDNLLIDIIDNEYSNVSILNTFDLNGDIFWKEYYLIIQMYLLSRKIADDKKMELTQPEYNPNIIKKVYNFKGEM